MNSIAVYVLALAGLAQSGVAQSQPAQQRPVDPAKAPAVAPAANPAPAGESRAQIKQPGKPAQPAAITTVDDLLNALETAGRDMRNMQANLRRTRFFPEIEGGGKQEWTGRIFFDNPEPKGGAPVRRKFQVDLDSTIRDGNIKQDEKTSWIFDGEWLVEKNAIAKQMHKRQVVPPGQSVDPLSLENGLFPLPIAQRRAEILQRFDAELLPPERFDSFQGGTFPAILNDTYQLRLVPKPGTSAARDLVEVRLWYRKEDLLPRMAWTKETKDFSNEYFLTVMQKNERLPSTAFDVNPPAGWTVQVDEYRKPAGQ